MLTSPKHLMALGLAAGIMYILPKRLILSKLIHFYKYRTIRAYVRTVVVMLDDIGMNYEKARFHAKKGAKIIIATQNLAKAEKAKKELITTTKNRQIRVISVNKHDKESLKAFAEKIINTESNIDVIINNNGKELFDLHIVFKVQELAKERFENHCLNFLYSP